MRQPLTAKLKLTTTPDQFTLLRQTILAYRDALNYVSACSFTHGKTSNTVRLQKRPIRMCVSATPCRREMACNVPRQVGATYKGLWTKWYKNQEARRKGSTK